MAPNNRIYALIVYIIGAALFYPGATVEIKTASACFGSQSDCDYFSLSCPGGLIHILNLMYGHKNYPCNDKKNKCFKESRNGCCVYKNGDCTEAFTTFHAYNLYRQCSGLSSCNSQQATRNALYTCDYGTNILSSYIYVEYECIPETQTMSFCENTTVSGPSVNIQFRAGAEVFDRPTDCVCSITSTDQVKVDFFDIRLNKGTTDTGSGSQCSSASLVSVPDIGLTPQCKPGLNEEVNFLYNDVRKKDVNTMEYKLNQLYNLDQQDAPNMVWIAVSDESGADVTVTCSPRAQQITTPTAQPTSGSTSNVSTPDVAVSGTNKDSGSNGAIVAGVLVPVLILIIVGGVVGYFIWRRRKRQPSKDMRAKPNSYSEDIPCADDEIYAEIGFVPDDVELDGANGHKKDKSNHDENRTCESNGIAIPTADGKHTYVNCGDANSAKHSKSPFKVLKTQKDKLISLFKKQSDNELRPPTGANRNHPRGSYDHITTNNIQIEVIRPTDEPAHVYSHTSAGDISQNMENKKKLNSSPNLDKKKLNSSPNLKKKDTVLTTPDSDVNAVHVGDSYIAFQFGKVDENDPNLVKMAPTDANLRPTPPSRPPPSPSGQRKVSPRSSPKPTKAPNQLSPMMLISPPSEDYAYATSEDEHKDTPASKRKVLNAPASTKQTTEDDSQETYDYADCSDDDAEVEESGPIYEDVEEDSTSKSIKHKSADASTEVFNYEVPISASPQIRPKSHPNHSYINTREVAKKKSKKSKKSANKSETLKSDKTNKSETPNRDKAKKDDKLESTALKSDNIDTKDYEKSNIPKSVTNMAKLFETKHAKEATGTKLQSKSGEPNSKPMQLKSSNPGVLKPTSSDA